MWPPTLRAPASRPGCARCRRTSPNEPTAGQVGAWLELADLVEDPAFGARVLEIGAAGTPEQPDVLQVDMGRLQTLGRQALAEHIAPGTMRADALVPELLDDGRRLGPDRRRDLADKLDTFTDARVERYWALLCVLNGWPTFEASTPAVE